MKEVEEEEKVEEEEEVKEEENYSLSVAQEQRRPQS